MCLPDLFDSDRKNVFLTLMFSHALCEWQLYLSSTANTLKGNSDTGFSFYIYQSMQLQLGCLVHFTKWRLGSILYSVIIFSCFICWDSWKKNFTRQDSFSFEQIATIFRSSLTYSILLLWKCLFSVNWHSPSSIERFILHYWISKKPLEATDHPEIWGYF